VDGQTPASLNGIRIVISPVGDRPDGVVTRSGSVSKLSSDPQKSGRRVRRSIYTRHPDEETNR
jgi:hypothetical protein